MKTEKEKVAMEHKIGEIFEYKGEWYQCVEGSWCRMCDFHRTNLSASQCNYRLNCFSSTRKDNKPVIFRKLKKVGEPFTIVGKLYQHYKVFDIDNVCGDGFWCIHNYKAKTLTIEIKQNEEDMEEYRMHDAREDIPEFNKVIDECLFGEDKLNLKPFDLEAAKAGKPVCTRDGSKARIICFDRKDSAPIIALIERVDGIEILQCVYSDGKCLHDMDSNNDLMMLTEKKEGWVNVYKHFAYRTKEEAQSNINPDNELIDTIKVEWEE